jgi:hypothetical protein
MQPLHGDRLRHMQATVHVSCCADDGGEYSLTVVSPRNYFLFTPLLPSECAPNSMCLVVPNNTPSHL